MQKVRFAYNPKAGETVITDWLDNIIDIYQRGGYSIMPYRLAFTETEETDLLDDIDGSYHHILVAGGDGTVNYVVNLLKRRNLDLPVAVLPTGTANDFANTLASRRTSRKPAGEFSAERSDVSIWAGPTTSISSTYSVAGFLPTSRKRRRRYSRTPSASWPTISEGSANCPTSGRCTFRSSPTEATTRDRR